jgi:hypothetical protein
MVSQAKAMALSRYNQKSISKQVSQEAGKKKKKEIGSHPTATTRLVIVS